MKNDLLSVQPIPRLLRALLATLAIGVAASCYPAIADGDVRYVAIGASLLLILLVTTLHRTPSIWTQFTVFLIAGNLLTIPFSYDPAPGLPPNYREELRIAGDLSPGFTGIQLISTDSKGYRTNTLIDYDHKPEGTFRVFAIGGSSTEQILLHDEKTWVAILGEKLQAISGRRIEAINTGVSGMRAEQHIRTLRKVEKYQPDLILIMMGINDWIRHIRIGDDPFARSASDLLQYVDLRHSLLARAYRGGLKLFAKNAGPKEFDVRHYVRQMDSLNRASSRKFYPRDVSGNYRRYADEIAAFCRSRNMACVLLDQPSAYHADISGELRRQLWMTPPFEDYTLTLENMIYLAELYNSWLRNFATSVGLPLCRIAESIPPRTQFFYDDCHFNEGGARRVAELLTDCIVAKNLTPK